MKVVESLVLVSQRQWGIIAPLRDASKVGRLGTCMLLTCFGFSIYDKNAQVGVLAHLDHAKQAVETSRQAAQFLLSLGAKELTVRTVNLTSAFLHQSARNQIIELRQLRVGNAIAELRKRGFSVNPAWMDMGESESGILDAKSGLKPVKYSELGVSEEQNREFINHYLTMLRDAKNGNLMGKSMSRKYIPVLV